MKASDYLFVFVIMNTVLAIADLTLSAFYFTTQKQVFNTPTRVSDKTFYTILFIVGICLLATAIIIYYTAQQHKAKYTVHDQWEKQNL